MRQKGSRGTGQSDVRLTKLQTGPSCGRGALWTAQLSRASGADSTYDATESGVPCANNNCWQMKEGCDRNCWQVKEDCASSRHFSDGIRTHRPIPAPVQQSQCSQGISKTRASCADTNASLYRRLLILLDLAEGHLPTLVSSRTQCSILTQLQPCKSA